MDALLAPAQVLHVSPPRLLAGEGLDEVHPNLAQRARALVRHKRREDVVHGIPPRQEEESESEDDYTPPVTRGRHGEKRTTGTRAQVFSAKNQTPVISTFDFEKLFFKA